MSSITPQTLFIQNPPNAQNPDVSGLISFNSVGNYICNSSYSTLNSQYSSTITTQNKDITIEAFRGNVGVISDIGILNLTSKGIYSNAVTIFAPNGGIVQQSGNAGISLLTSNGDINLLSQGSNINIGVSPVGTPANQQTQDVNIECFNNFNTNAGDMYFVSSDVISFVSATGDIQFGTSSNGAPTLKFENGNVLINQSTSPLDYQLDIAVTHESDSKPGHNGIMVNSKASNVAAEITLQTSNTIGDGTQCKLSMGAYGLDDKYAVYQVYLASQTGNVVVRLDGPSYSPNSINNSTFGRDFNYADVGRQLYWPLSDRLETITGLGTIITASNDTSNITITGTYTGNESRVYLLQIDSTATPNTFKWSNNGGVSFQQIYVPITSTGPIALDNGLLVSFAATTGYSINQQFTFQTKITAIVDNSGSISTPETMYSLQPFYAYLQTATPSDIVIRTNSTEKMRITGDGAIGIQNKVPTAAFDINSNYGKVLAVNQTVAGYQLNPSVATLESGGYILVWNSQDASSPGLNFNVVGQRYMADGSRYGYNFLINNTTSNNQSFPTVAGSKLQNSNHYLVAWSNNNTATGKYNIYCQIYHNNEPVHPTDIFLGSSSSYNQLYPRAASLANGSYIITWADDNGAGGNIYGIYGAIITDDDNPTITIPRFAISPASANSRNYPYVAGLAVDDDTYPGGFVVGYMTAIDTSPDPRYTVAIKVYSADTTATSGEIPITDVGSAAYSSISDGLLSVAEINNHLVNQPNGGFVMSFYRNYQADTSLFQIGDPVSGLLSGATGVISALDPITRTISLSSVSNRFLVSEELDITSSLSNVGLVVEKVQSITFPTDTTANIVLDNGSKNVVAYRFNSNLTSSSDALWNIQVNTSPLYTDLDRFSGNANIFTYKRPLAAISVDNEGTGLVTWSNGSIPSIYYQLFDTQSGALINSEKRLTSQYDGLKQRDQVVTHLQSIQGNDYGFVISWDNQSLDLENTGIYQQLIGHNHSLISIADGVSNLIFNHQNQLGIGISEPASSIHIKTQTGSSIYDPANPAIMTLQNTSNHVITNTTLQGIQCLDGKSNILNQIQSINSLRYDDLYPAPSNLKGFYKFDQTQGTQAVDYSSASTFLDTNDLPVYINTNGILENFDIENCWQPGLINNSLLFDGVDDYVYVDNEALNGLNTILETGPNQLTLSCWINVPSNVVVGSSYDLVSNGGNMSIPGTYLLGLRDAASNGSLSIYSNVTVDGPAIIAANGTRRLNDSQWHHIVETVDNSDATNLNINIYVDGVLEVSTTAAGAITTVQHAATNTYIGSRNGANGFYRGYLDELRFYNTLLSTSQISQLYNYGNPIQAAKGSLVLKPGNATYNQAIVIDDDGKINNLSSRPLPYTILSGELIAYSSNANVQGSGTKFINELTIGDNIVLDASTGANGEFTVLSIVSNTFITIDRTGYGGPEESKSYQSVLRKPSIYTFFNNADEIRGNIDNYGNLIVGSGKASSMLTVSGQSNTSNLIPEVSIVNTSQVNTQYGRATAINFQGYNATNNLLPPVSLGRIETSHNKTGTDNKGIMKISVNDGTQLNTLLSLTSNGYIGVGGGTSGQNNPLTLIHATTQGTSAECEFLLESNYHAGGPSTDSVFDERSDIYFAGLSSITETTNPNVRYKVLAAVSGSNDGNAKDLVGRLDFAVNNNTTTVKNGLESKMCIDHTGNVGVNILQPSNTLSVCPERRINSSEKNTISSTSGNQITLSNNIFSGLTDEQKAMFIGGVVVVESTSLITSKIASVDSNNQLTVADDLAAYVGEIIYVHKAGLNVANTGYTGVNTTSPGSVLSVAGSFSAPIVMTENDLTLDARHHTIIGNTQSGDITITLPANSAAIAGRIYVIKKFGAATLTVDPGSAKIDDTPGIVGISTLNHFQSDGTDWWIIV